MIDEYGPPASTLTVTAVTPPGSPAGATHSNTSCRYSASSRRTGPQAPPDPGQDRTLSADPAALAQRPTTSPDPPRAATPAGHLPRALSRVKFLKQILRLKVGPRRCSRGSGPRCSGRWAGRTRAPRAGAVVIGEQVAVDVLGERRRTSVRRRPPRHRHRPHHRRGPLDPPHRAQQDLLAQPKQTTRPLAKPAKMRPMSRDM